MKAINTLRLPPVLLLTLCFNIRTHAQVRPTRERYITGGYNFSFFGVSPSRGGSRSGSSFKRTVVLGDALEWQNLSQVWQLQTILG